MSFFRRKNQQLQKQNSRSNTPTRDDARYCVWCKFYIPNQAHHKTVLCENPHCGKQLPLRGNTEGYNVPWTRCVHCDAFMRRDFNFCQECGYTTELGNSFLRKRQALQQAAALKVKQQRLQEKFMGSSGDPGDNGGSRGGAPNSGANGGAV